MAKLSELDKRIKAEAQEDWNNQCKAFMLYRRPFRDKTMKDCFNRHKKTVMDWTDIQA